ncbi:chitin deacetylase 8-like [Brevipalpus obovatus]|uniref:chitin deacetylase 8-like n=1 Tax=Brevipalpus obovatus TaxID=246614 RepID=UPI003D9EF0E3
MFPVKIMSPIFCALFILIIILVHIPSSDAEYCVPSQCLSPGCSCPSTQPIMMDSTQIPQLVMLTFDDGVNRLNYATYQQVLGRVHTETRCPAKATFFVSHEFTDYSLVHELWRRGNEIGVHSISHDRDINRWSSAPVGYWRAEMGGMKRLLSHFAKIPLNDIKGIRVPFLQSSGDNTWLAMRDENFLYDSSVPVRNYMNPPLYPYSLDYGMVDDCQIEPCPVNRHPGLWEVSMVPYTLSNQDHQGRPWETICAMVDACVPNPNTTELTYKFLIDNFRRHYYSNRAPFPIFMHEFWLLDEYRKAGFYQFLDYILSLNDVFMVTITDILDFMRNPENIDDYKRRMNKRCIREPAQTACSQPGGTMNCEYTDDPRFKGYPRIMKICGDICPAKYPWVNNPIGENIKVVSHT